MCAAKSQSRIKHLEYRAFRALKNDWDDKMCNDRRLVRDLRYIARLRETHSVRYYGFVDKGHRTRIEWLEAAADEYERRGEDIENGVSSNWSPIKTRRMLQSRTAPTSPVKSPVLAYHRNGDRAMC